MIWRFTFSFNQNNYGQIRDQTGLFYTTNLVFYTGQSDQHVWESLLYRGSHFFGGGNQRPAASHLQTLSHNVVSSTPCLSRIRTHNVNGDRH